MNHRTKPGILSSTFHFPEMMLNLITSSVSDSLAMCPVYKVMSFGNAERSYLAVENMVGKAVDPLL